MNIILENILKFLGGAANVFVKFMASAIIPLVVWLVLLRADVDQLKAKALEINHTQESFNQRVRERFLRIEEAAREERQLVQKNQEDILRAIGRLEGRIERLR